MHWKPLLWVKESFIFKTLLYQINIILLESEPERDLGGNWGAFCFGPSLWCVVGLGVRDLLV